MLFLAINAEHFCHSSVRERNFPFNAYKRTFDLLNYIQIKYDDELITDA